MVLTSDLASVAERYRAKNLPDSPPLPLTGVRPRLDERYCRDVADAYDRAPMLDLDDDLRHGYDVVAAQSLQQYELIRQAGIRVRPWRGGPPYRDSAELRREVHRTRTLRLHLTRDGHGPAGAGGYHPLRAPSGVSEDGIPLCHNDILRAVHDVFGHVLFGAGFGTRGEFTATHRQLLMYSPAAHPVLFTEHIGQICWFFHGPHLRDGHGVPRRPGDPGYLPPPLRPYPPQKVFRLSADHLSTFWSLFDVEEPQ